MADEISARDGACAESAGRATIRASLDATDGNATDQKPAENAIVDALIRLVGKLPSSWLLRTTQLRRAQETRPGFRYPKVEPLLEWCLERGFRCRDSAI